MLLDSEGHKPHALFVADAQGAKLDTGLAFAAVKTMQPHIAKIFSVKAPWRIAQIKLKAVVFLSGSVWLTDLT
jgi:hypothetical protein